MSVNDAVIIYHLSTLVSSWRTLYCGSMVVETMEYIFGVSNFSPSSRTLSVDELDIQRSHFLEYSSVVLTSHISRIFIHTDKVIVKKNKSAKKLMIAPNNL